MWVCWIASQSVGIKPANHLLDYLFNWLWILANGWDWLGEEEPGCILEDVPGDVVSLDIYGRGRKGKE